ncbi:MAG: FkbM family methyltransferase [Blastomonas sp.]
MNAASSLRGRLAAHTPGFVRKAVRMAEHYGRRHVEWLNILREMQGASLRDRLVLGTSALAAPITSLRRMDGFEPPLPLADIDVMAKGVGRFSLRAGTDDIIHVLSAREPAVRRVVESCLGPGDVFVDAGANIGFFSVLAQKQVGPAGQVIAFEMMPETAARLRHHFAINALPSARVIENALSDSDGDILVATSSASKFGQASISAQFSDVAERTIRHEVRTIRLDTALADTGEIALIKMDLEGAEYAALCGADAVLARTRAIIFENNAGDSRIPDLLRAKGFVVEHLDGSDYLARRS